MADKDIINGIDVSKCEFYSGPKLCMLGDIRVPKEIGYSDIYCCTDSDCYFKQSARKDERIRELYRKLNLEVKALGKMIETVEEKDEEIQILNYILDFVIQKYLPDADTSIMHYTSLKELIVNGIEKDEQKLSQIADITDRGIKNSLCNCGLRADLEQIKELIEAIHEHRVSEIGYEDEEDTILKLILESKQITKENNE